MNKSSQPTVQACFSTMPQVELIVSASSQRPLLQSTHPRISVVEPPLMTEHPLMIETNLLPVHDTQSPPMTHTHSPIAYTRSVPAAEKQLAKQPPSSANASSKKFKVKVRLPKSAPPTSKTTNATTILSASHQCNTPISDYCIYNKLIPC